MLIRCKQQRPGGSIIELGKGADKRDYHFKPTDAKDPDSPHVCEVSDKDDLGTLLAIKEGYEIFDGKVAKAPVKAAAAVTETGGEGKGGDANPYASKTKDELIAMIAERTGKKPHVSTGIPKLIATLEKLDQDQK